MGGVGVGLGAMRLGEVLLLLGPERGELGTATVGHHHARTVAKVGSGSNAWASTRGRPGLERCARQSGRRGDKEEHTSGACRDGPVWDSR
jgi:hypothetical protein